MHTVRPHGTSMGYDSDLLYTATYIHTGNPMNTNNSDPKTITAAKNEHQWCPLSVGRRPQRLQGWYQHHPPDYLLLYIHTDSALFER